MGVEGGRLSKTIIIVLSATFSILDNIYLINHLNFTLLY